MPQPPEDGLATVLLTRPQAASARFAAALAAVAPGVPVVIAPLMRIVPVAHDAALLRSAPAVVLTSAEAVPAAGEGAGRLALCVGEGTAAAAAAAGFAVQRGRGNGAEGLLPLIAACPLPLIHPHGRHLARALPVPGMVVYDQQPLAPGRDARALLAGARAVVLPLFSPRSARLAAAAATGGAAAPLRVVAISPATARAWRGPVAAVAPAMDAGAMRQAVLAAWADASGKAEQSPAKPG